MTPLKKLTLLLFDFVAVNTALSLFLYSFRDLEEFNVMEKKTFFSLVNLMWLLVSFYSHRLYGRFQYTGFNRELRNMMTDISWFSFFFTFVYVFVFDNAIQYLFSFLALVFGALVLCRFAIKFFAPSFTAEQKLKYITVGYSPALPGIEKTIHEVYYGRIQHIGAFGKKEDPLQNYVGEINDIFDFMREHHIDLVLYSSNALSPTLVTQLMRFSKQNFIGLNLIPVELEVLDESGAKLELHNGFPLLSAKDEKISHLKSQLLKRAFDLVFSSLVIVFLLSCVMPLIALLIVLESKGSPIFVQNRIGHRGHRFKCLKFRSMSVQENGSSVVQARQNDARITKIGAFIRRNNIDELPQQGRKLHHEALR
jgi:putative colanic acid biosynthesis UDP-glucose lipid carrier transferase